LAEARADRIIRTRLAQIQSVQRSDRDPTRKQWTVERFQRDMEYEVAKLADTRSCVDNFEVLSKLMDKSPKQDYDVDLIQRCIELASREKYCGRQTWLAKCRTVLPMVCADRTDVGLWPRLGRVLTFFSQSIWSGLWQLMIASEIFVLNTALKSALKKSR